MISTCILISGEPIPVDTPQDIPLTDTITPLPGKGCLFYQKGHCLYEEMVNPGFCSARQCVVLQGLQKKFDAFVDRAECFNLDPLTAGQIWERLAAGLSTSVSCEHYVKDPQGEHDSCVYQHDSACVLLCPPCIGRCSRFHI